MILFTSTIPIWVTSCPVLATTAFLGVAYSLFAYVSVVHGKEKAGVVIPCPVQTHLAAVTACMAMRFDMGFLV